jgi:hypothetical protein
MVSDAAPRAILSLRERGSTGLPWSIAVSSAEPNAEAREFASRRRFLLAAFGLLAASVGVASYTMGRGVQRELGAARQQSDFVAAVSHEFR